jgi:hypothetical protein
MRTPRDSGLVGWAFTLAVAFMLVMAIWPAMADAPMMIRPVAVCEHSKCVMSEADYTKWQEYHLRVLEANDAIAAAMKIEQAENAALRQQLARVARGCGRERQT